MGPIITLTWRLVIVEHGVSRVVDGAGTTGSVYLLMVFQLIFMVRVVIAPSTPSAMSMSIASISAISTVLPFISTPAHVLWQE